eukprot:COSAG02_NODE_27610_length_606_cov_0.798817_2_plen_74_part_00
MTKSGDSLGPRKLTKNEPDILPLGDVGLINAIKKHYAVYEPEAYKKIAQKWHPYASVATWYLWATIDDEIVQY